MCGITGIIQPVPGQYNKEHLGQMTAALAHRGPDGDGYWQNQSGTVLLGHRRLSILDLTAAAAQPFHYLDRYTLLHNGEIYNYIELRDELRNKGYHFRTATDTEVIAAAYDQWKQDCVLHFDGMFAFTIWDEQERELFAARDRFGEKPFHYIFDPHSPSLMFASEIKAFWAINRGKAFNRRMLFNFLTIGYTDNPNEPDETFYDDVKKLPAASRMKIQFYPAFSMQTEKYWDIDLDAREPSISDQVAIEKFRETFQRSVRRRLRSDVPLGTSLSGGLDSSSIVAAICNLDMNAAIDPKMKTFSIVFPDFEKNEEKYIDEAVTYFRVNSFKTKITDNEIQSLFKKVVEQQDEPFGTASALSQNQVFKLAAENDVKVLLDGQGADETLAGYHKYYKWYWQELFSKRRLLKSGEIAKARRLGVNEKFGIRNIVASFFPDFASAILEKQYLLRALKHEDLTRDFVRLQSKEAYYTTPAIFSLNGLLYFNTCMHGLEELLRYADRNSMAHGREVRLPFLSHELVEFIFSLPAHFKIRDGWTKWILRKASEKVLPVNISWRKDKIGFEPPQRHWMQLPVVRDMIDQAKQKLVAEKILKPHVINKEIRATSAYERDNYDWRYLVSAQFL